MSSVSSRKQAAAPWSLAWPRYWPPPADEDQAAAEAIRRDADAVTTALHGKDMGSPMDAPRPAREGKIAWH